MSKLQRDEVMLSTVLSDGKCLIGNSADVYKNDGTLKKRYQEQINRLGLHTMKVVAGTSYTIMVYAVRPDYMLR